MSVAFKEKVITSVNDFIHEVITDGRYLQDFIERPFQVASALGLEITPEVAEQVSIVDLEQLLRMQPPVQIISDNASGTPPERDEPERHRPPHRPERDEPERDSPSRPQRDEPEPARSPFPPQPDRALQVQAPPWDYAESIIEASADQDAKL